MGKRLRYKRLIDNFIVACQWCWYGIADKVRLWLARRRKTDGDLVSIIMPTIGRNVTKAVDSVLAQTYKNWELIIVGDGTWPYGDRPWQYYEEFFDRIQAERIPKKVHYPTDDPKYQWLAGPCRAINCGLSRARGDWIARIDDDDVWDARHLKRALAAAKWSDAEFVSFSIDLNGQRPAPDTHYGQTVGAVQSWLYRGYLKCFKTNLHCWRKSWNAVNDIDLSRRMARAGVKMSYHIDSFPHVTIKPREGLTEVGIKGWLQERGKGENNGKFSGCDTGAGRQQGDTQQEH